MDFISETFPNTRLHMCLYKIQPQQADSQIVEFPDKLQERRTQLAQLAKQYQSSFTLINAQLIVSLMHMNIAVSRALLNRRDGSLKTNCLGNEIVYFCAPNHSINNTLDTYGVKNCSTALFALFVDMSGDNVA